jgi:hypothetical protein
VANQTTTVPLTITTAGGGGSINWRFCDATRMPLWFAYRNGTNGAWVRVNATGGDTFSFSLTGGLGAVAYVQNLTGSGTQGAIFLFSAAELSGLATNECVIKPATKALSGSFAGLGAGQTGWAYVAGSTGSAAFPLTTFNMPEVDLGVTDLVAFRSTTDLTGTTTPDRMLMRRNVNYPVSSAIPVIDFAGGVAPATANITVANAGADVFDVLPDGQRFHRWIPVWSALGRRRGDAAVRRAGRAYAGGRFSRRLGKQLLGRCIVIPHRHSVQSRSDITHPHDGGHTQCAHRDRHGQHAICAHQSEKRLAGRVQRGGGGVDVAEHGTPRGRSGRVPLHDWRIRFEDSTAPGFKSGDGGWDRQSISNNIIRSLKARSRRRVAITPAQESATEPPARQAVVGAVNAITFQGRSAPPVAPPDVRRGAIDPRLLIENGAWRAACWERRVPSRILHRTRRPPWRSPSGTRTPPSRAAIRCSRRCRLYARAGSSCGGECTGGAFALLPRHAGRL